MMMMMMVMMTTDNLPYLWCNLSLFLRTTLMTDDNTAILNP